jgi:predicted enzyme related to lactoylglutathione lyase
MSLSRIIGEYAIVEKLDVQDLHTSLDFYVSKLKLRHDPRWDVPNSWAQVQFPEYPRIGIGLNQTTQPNACGGPTFTFVVDDITAVRQALIAEGIQVSEIHKVAHGISLCFFYDPDKNRLGLRQDHRIKITDKQ